LHNGGKEATMILLTGSESMTRLFDLDWQLLADSCLTIIAVFVLFLALSYFLFNPARKMLDSRKQKIHDELEDTKKNMESARKLKAEYEEKLKNIDKEAEGILSDARKRALANENQIVEKAKEEASRIIERARVEAELEKQKMADDVKKEIVSVASVLAGKVVAGSIDTTVQDKLIDETLKEMGDSTWLS
jgi:F-type H+-transporting ATPase subunit b